MLKKIALFFALSLSTVPTFGANKDLVIYTYDSFLSDWGPGPDLKTKFEAQCNCKIKWVAAADGSALLTRLKIEGTKTRADLVIGIDSAITAAANSSGLFTDSGLDQQKSLPHIHIKQDKKFVPYDYGFFALMYDTHAKQKNGQPFPKPKSFDDLLNSRTFEKSILIQDPRSSATGLGLLLWIQAVFKNEAKTALQRLKKQTLKVAKGWSESYSLFTKGEAPLVLSYTTSEAYHREVEKERRYEAIIFPEGHYVSYENAAIIKTSKNIELARSFLKFMLSEDSQRVIASKNWMYPVLELKSGLPESFKLIGKPKKILQLPSDEIELNRRRWISEWEKAFLN